MHSGAPPQPESDHAVIDVAVEVVDLNPLGALEQPPEIRYGRQYQLAPSCKCLPEMILFWKHWHLPYDPQ